MYETNKKIRNRPLAFAKEHKQYQFCVTDLLERNEFFSPETTYVFEQLIGLDIQEEHIYEPPTIILDVVLSTLWGNFMETVFNWCYFK